MAGDEGGLRVAAKPKVVAPASKWGLEEGRMEGRTSLCKAEEDASDYAIRPTAVDNNLWKIAQVKEGAETTGLRGGVRGFLTAAPGPVMAGFHQWLKNT